MHLVGGHTTTLLVRLTAVLPLLPDAATRPSGSMAVTPGSQGLSVVGGTPSAHGLYSWPLRTRTTGLEPKISVRKISGGLLGAGAAAFVVAAAAFAAVEAAAPVLLVGVVVEARQVPPWLHVTCSHTVHFLELATMITQAEPTNTSNAPLRLSCSPISDDTQQHNELQAHPGGWLQHRVVLHMQSLKRHLPYPSTASLLEGMPP